MQGFKNPPTEPQSSPVDPQTLDIVAREPETPIVEQSVERIPFGGNFPIIPEIVATPQIDEGMDLSVSAMEEIAATVTAPIMVKVSNNGEEGPSGSMTMLQKKIRRGLNRMTRPGYGPAVVEQQTITTTVWVEGEQVQATIHVQKQNLPHSLAIQAQQVPITLYVDGQVIQTQISIPAQNTGEFRIRPKKKKKKVKVDPILQSNPNRFVLFPIKYSETYKFYKQHLACFWTADEIDLVQDISDWHTKLLEEERYFIKYVLAFFAASDGIVLENIAEQFLSEVQIPEARCFYGFQIAMENIHSQTYSLLIDTYITKEDEKLFLLNALTTIPVIRDKADWAMMYMDRSKPFQERLIAFAAVQGIFFSGAFCSIFWLKKRNLMPGLTFSNELISRDEGLHTNFACHLYSLMESKLPRKQVIEIIKSAVDIEINFIVQALPCELIGINSDSMTEYIKFVADRLIFVLTGRKYYKAKNPFEWMDLISIEGKTNFFEKRVGEYQKSGVMGGRESNTFQKDAEF